VSGSFFGMLASRTEGKGVLITMPPRAEAKEPICVYKIRARNG
jgi:hypothetical protein